MAKREKHTSKTIMVFNSFGKRDISIRNTFSNKIKLPLTPSEMNLMYLIFFHFQRTREHTITLTKKEISSQYVLSKSRDYPSYETFLANVAKKFAGFVIQYSASGDEVELFSLFPTITYSEERMKIEIHKSFVPFLKTLKSDYTAFNIDEFFSIGTINAKNLYRLLKQYYFLGKARFSSEEICNYIYPNGESDASLSSSHLTQTIARCVNALSPRPKNGELDLFPSPFPNLSFTPIRGGRNVVAYLFEWDVPEKSFFSIVKSASDFRKWLIDNIDSNQPYTNLFMFNKKVISIGRYSRIRTDNNFNGAKFLIDHDGFTKTEAVNSILESIFELIMQGRVEEVILPDNIFINIKGEEFKVESHSYLLGKYFSNLFSYDPKKLQKGYMEDSENVIIECNDMSSQKREMPSDSLNNGIINFDFSIPINLEKIKKGDIVKIVQTQRIKGGYIINFVRIKDQLSEMYPIEEKYFKLLEEHIKKQRK